MAEFLLANLPILICVLVGLILLAVEMFIPGFGVAGISGVIALVVGAVMLYLKSGLLIALEYSLGAMVLVAVSLSITLKSASSGKLSKSPFVLMADESKEAQMEEGEADIFLGREGEAITVLRPSGIAEFDGVRLNVVTEGDFIRQGCRVLITRVEGSRIVVREA